MTSNGQIERAAAAWLARRDAGGWSAREQTQLDGWLAESTAHRVAWLRLASAWEQSDRLKALGAGLPRDKVPPRRQWSLSPLFDPHHVPGQRAKPSPHPLIAAARARRWPELAGIGIGTAALLVVTVIFGLRWNAAPPIHATVYRTATGGHESVRLADGSEATLSSDTRIAVAFSRGERDIALPHGETFFIVSKDAQRPFVVATGKARVIAVGTRFAVRREGTKLRVVVTEGVVRLESAGADTPTILLPAGSVAQVTGNDVLVRHPGIAQAREYLSWRDGYVVFHDTPLADAVAELNRYTTRKILIGDPSVASLRIGGNFRWSNSAAFVRLLTQVFPLRAEQRDGDTILLARK